MTESKYLQPLQRPLPSHTMLQGVWFQLYSRRLFFASLFALVSVCVLLLYVTRSPLYARFPRGHHWRIFRSPKRDTEHEEDSTTEEASNITLFFGEPTAGDTHIIFLETSCSLTDVPTPAPHDSDSGLRMTPRAACAMTSAARMHPDRLVFYLHTCQLNRSALARGFAPAFALAVLSNPNFRLWDLRYKDAFIGTPLEEWSRSDALQRSRYPVIHGSDVLRFVVLWRYGGTYLDTDVLMIRSIGELRDFTCPESAQSISIGAMDMSLSDVGRRVANVCIDEIQNHFKPLEWGYNGPGALTRALKKLCATKEIPKMAPELCGGFTVLPTPTFYPIYGSSWKLYFQEENAASTMKKVEKSLGVHVWNALSHNEAIFTNSSQPYAQLARRLCPSVVAALNGTM